MSHRLVGLCTALLVGGVLVAACGGGGSNTTTTTKASTTTKSSTSSKVASQTTSATSSVSLPSTATAAIIADCQKSISVASTLSSSEKSELIDACKKAAAGNIAGARAAYEQVCETVVKDTVPSGSAQTLALSSCKEIGSSTGSTAPTSSTTPAGPTTANGITAAELLAACQEYEGAAGALLPGNVKSELTTACAQAKAGNVTGAETALKQVCETYAQLAPASERSEISAGCKEI
jgi:hypothetical protein